MISDLRIYTHREVLFFVDQFTTLCSMTTGALPAVRCIWIFWWTNMPAGWQCSEWSSYNSQIIEGVENAVPLHRDIPRAGGRCSDFPFEAVLQQYLQFPYEYFLLVFFHLGVTVVKNVLQTTPELKITRNTITWTCWPIQLLIILSPVTSDKACIDILAVWAVGESCWNQP
jgi:hypothetical protein